MKIRFKIIVINNCNYNLKGIIDNYDFCHNRAALPDCLYFAIKRTYFESRDFGISPGAPNPGHLHALKARIAYLKIL